MNRPVSPWAPLRHRAFCWLWLGVVVSSLGLWAQTVGAQWLFVDDPDAATIVTLVQTATTRDEPSGDVFSSQGRSYRAATSCDCRQPCRTDRRRLAATGWRRRNATKDDGLSLVVPTLAPMLPGQQGWLSAMWSATTDLCDVKITVAGPGLSVSYPANTTTYTSLYTNSALATGNLDYAAFKVTVPSTITNTITVAMDITYQQLPPGQIKKDDDLKTKKVDCKGPAGQQRVTASLPVTPQLVAALQQITKTVTVAKGKPAWIEIRFRGLKPNLGSFRVTLSPPNGLLVTYPGDGSAAGLNENAALPVGHEDHVAVRLDASGLAPGAYQVPLRATYTGGSFDGELSLTVT